MRNEKRSTKQRYNWHIKFSSNKTMIKTELEKILTTIEWAKNVWDVILIHAFLSQTELYFKN